MFDIAAVMSEVLAIEEGIADVKINPPESSPAIPLFAFLSDIGR